jgi:hypothetical protein
MLSSAAFAAAEPLLRSSCGMVDGFKSILIAAPRSKCIALQLSDRQLVRKL